MYDKDTPTTDLVTNSFVLMIISLCHLYHNNIVSYMYMYMYLKSDTEKGLGTNLVSWVI